MKFIDLKTQNKLIKSELIISLKKIMNESSYIMGKDVDELEKKLSSFIKSKHCITVSSGTDALLISLMSLNISLVTKL